MCPLYVQRLSRECLLFRGFQCIEVYGETVVMFGIVRYIVPAVVGCPLRGVPLYSLAPKIPYLCTKLRP